MPEKKAHVSEAKKRAVTELAELIKNYKTILIASIKGIPGGQFQEIVKGLRGKAIVKVPKKSLIIKAINADASKDKGVEELKDKIKGNEALLFSNSDAFELAGDLIKSKMPAKAKPGQEAPEDIEIPEGPTDLVPGPAISELGALGIQIQIDKGKIMIKAPKVIVKKGEEISRAAAEVMSKLDIKPFAIGFVPLCAFDKENKIFYNEINVDPEAVIGDIRDAFGRALPFAVEIGYINDETIGFLISKAARNEKVIEGLLGNEDNNSQVKSQEGEK